MVDPHNVTKFDRTRIELEEYLLFCIIVANKIAVLQARKLEAFLEGNLHQPFKYIEGLIQSNTLRSKLEEVKMGQYYRIVKSFEGVVKLDPATCSFGDLMGIIGIGAKTANYFLLHSRSGYTGVVLDTHVLKHLNNNGIPAPKATPSFGVKYIELAKAFTKLWKQEHPELSLAEYDLMIWRKYTKTKEIV